MAGAITSFGLARRVCFGEQALASKGDALEKRGEKGDARYIALEPKPRPRRLRRARLDVRFAEAPPSLSLQTDGGDARDSSRVALYSERLNRVVCDV